MLGPGRFAMAHHANALYELGTVLGGPFVPVLLARVCDEAAHLGVVA